jgi:pimeloyl-ACP methyl ester carboxylesterase
MKLFFYVLAFQMLVQFAYGQSVDSLQNDEIQKVLEQQLFPGSKLDRDFIFKFSGTFLELKVETKDGYKLNGLLFKAKQPKGLIFYLHGSNDALNTWGKIAPVYNNLNYDIFILDYRGYGKSGGKVTSESQLYSDVQEAYDKLKLTYPETKIILIGQSVGTGPAAMLAANNNPRKLILQAPYYSLPDWIHNVVPDIDTSSMKYQFKTYEFLQKTKAPVIIFHGDTDDAIYCGSSQKLSKLFKQGDKLFILKGEGHNDFTKNQEYLKEIRNVLK